MSDDELAIKSIEKIGLLMDKTDIGFTLVHSEALSLAISALQERIERDNPKPLTLQELLFSKQNPVFIRGEFPNGWQICYGKRKSKKRGEEVINFGNGVYKKINEYNKTWIAYRYKPKEEQHDRD